LKPSDRIEQLAREIAVEQRGHGPFGELSDAKNVSSVRIEAVTRYLDELHESTKTWNEFLSVAEAGPSPQFNVPELIRQMEIKDRRILHLSRSVKEREQRIEELKSRTLNTFNVSEAVKKLQLALEADPDFYQTWKSNIAMAVYDELDPHIKMETCNRVAERFLRVLCTREKNDG
jgi:hypothetical protein